MSQDDWEELYRAATLEVDGKRMPYRVAVAREAIHLRLQELEDSSNHHAEREQLKITLEHLKVLESESQQW